MRPTFAFDHFKLISNRKFIPKLLKIRDDLRNDPNFQEAIQKLRETEEMLGKKQEFLEKKVNDVRGFFFNLEFLIL